jgi:hypothetical protein
MSQDRSFDFPVLQAAGLMQRTMNVNIMTQEIAYYPMNRRVRQTF